MDFLNQRNDLAIKKELRGLRDSYHHYWDLLAEMLQNSRDAITRAREAGGAGPYFIKLKIDSSKSQIQVTDNGIGIPAAKIQDVLAPGGGDKDGSTKEVGEKGVGLTYAIFSGNDFEIESRTAGQAISGGRVVNAQQWLSTDDASVPRPVYAPYAEAPEALDAFVFGEKTYPMMSFTRITVSQVMPSTNDRNLFTMTRSELRYLARTRTAVGVTTSLYGDEGNREFDVYLELALPGENSSEELDAQFYAPHLYVKHTNRVTLQEVRDAFVPMSDVAQRRKFVGSKTVWHAQTIQEGSWEVKVYGAMLPENDAFRVLSRDTLLLPEPTGANSDDVLFRSGIFVATKGMPTVMSLPQPEGGRYPAYYKRCFFMVESRMLKFDLGRKSLHYTQVRKLQAAVRDLFLKFEEIARYQGDETIEPSAPSITKAERQALTAAEWTRAEGLVDLGEPQLRYAKIPGSQEAAVAAVFHELIGAKILSSYRTLTTGYGHRYDAHVHYLRNGQSPLRTLIEFKYTLDALIDDLANEKKYLEDIHLLIAWDANEQKLKDKGLVLAVTTTPAFEGVTHELSAETLGVEAVPVILLKHFFDRRRATA